MVDLLPSRRRKVKAPAELKDRSGPRKASAIPLRWVPPVVVVFSLLLLPITLETPLFAGAQAALLLLVASCAWFGLEHTSYGVMLLSFALAPADTLVVGGFLGYSDALFALALILAIPGRAGRARHRLPILFVTSAIVFSVISILAGIGSAYPGESYYYCARVIFTLIGIPVLLVWWSPTMRQLVGLAIAYGAGTSVSIVIGIPDIGAYRNFGLTQHPNILGYTAVLTISLLPFLFRALSPANRWWICGGLFAFAMLGVMTSGSRAALGVAILLAVLVPAVERSVGAGLAVAAGGAIGLYYVVSTSVANSTSQNALQRLLGAGDVDGSDRARVEGVEKTWAVALDRPFTGGGFTFSDFVGHNLYVQVAAAAGFLGLAAFVVLCLSMVTTLFVTSDPRSRLAYPMMVFLMAGPVSPNLTDRFIGFLLGMSLVGVVAVNEARKDELAEAADQRRDRRVARAVDRVT